MSQKVIDQLVKSVLDRLIEDPAWSPLDDHVFEMLAVANSITIFALAAVPDAKLRELVAQQVEDNLPRVLAAAGRRHARLKGDQPSGALH